MLLLVLLITAILADVRWHLIILICISLIANELEYYFVYLLAICMSWKKCLFGSFANFLIGLFVGFFFWCWVVWVLYKFWILTSWCSCCLQISSPIQLAICLFCWQFLFLCRSCLVWHSPIYLFLPLIPLPLGSNS